MEDLPIQKPRNALEELWHLIFPMNISDDSVIELVISITPENISIRDLSAFLELVDHVYGRITPGGFRSYARKDFGHLKISRVHVGSCKLILETALSPEIFLIIWLILKYLPQAFKNTASAYNEYEQGRLARETRKRIKMEMCVWGRFSWWVGLSEEVKTGYRCHEQTDTSFLITFGTPRLNELCI